MATATEKSYRVITLDDIEPGVPLTPEGGQLRQRLEVRRHLGITAFGVNAVRALGTGELIREHTEDGPFAAPQDELYVVLEGKATLEIDGETVEAPAGSFVYVRPEARRSAVSQEKGTTVMMIGSPVGQAYEPQPPEAADAFAAYNAGDYETAVEKQKAFVAARPDSVVGHFNLACFAARAGRGDDAFEHLRKAVELDDRVKEYLAKDEDLESLRDDPRFAELAK